MKSINTDRDTSTSEATITEERQEMEAALADAFAENVRSNQEQFSTLVTTIILPEFRKIRASLSKIGQDAVIVIHLRDGLTQMIGMKFFNTKPEFDPRKTVQLLNPTDHTGKWPNTLFYELSGSENLVCIRQKWNQTMDPIISLRPPDEITGAFIEAEMACFLRKAFR